MIGSCGLKKIDSSRIGAEAHEDGDRDHKKGGSEGELESACLEDLTPPGCSVYSGANAASDSSCGDRECGETRSEEVVGADLALQERGASGAASQVLIELMAACRIEFLRQIKGRHIIKLIAAHQHIPFPQTSSCPIRWSRSETRPRLKRDTTVPMGSDNSSAISL